MYHSWRNHPEITDRQNAAETAKRWGISKRRVLQLCRENKVYAAKKIDGEWTIPSSAVKPVDGRFHRGIRIPDHLKIVLDYADAAVRDVPGNGRGWSLDAFEYFIRGSAFHLHTLETSRLNFDDVCQVLAGNAVGGKPLDEQMDVIYHQRAARFVSFAIRDGRRLSVRMVEELHGLLACGDKRMREPMKERKRVEDSVKRVRATDVHPVCKAADFMVRFLVLRPFSEHNERTAYMVANFILMNHGYPPVILYRAVFKWWRRHIMGIPPWQNDFNRCETTLAEDWGELLDEKPRPGEMPEEMLRRKSQTLLDPTIFASLIAKCVHRSCRTGLMRAIPEPEPDPYDWRDI